MKLEFFIFYLSLILQSEEGERNTSTHHSIHSCTPWLTPTCPPGPNRVPLDHPARGMLEFLHVAYYSEHYTTLFQEEFGNIHFKVFEAFIFINSITPLLRLCLKK